MNVLPRGEIRQLAEKGKTNRKCENTNDLITEYPKIVKDLISDWEKWIAESETK